MVKKGLLENSVSQDLWFIVVFEWNKKKLTDILNLKQNCHLQHKMTINRNTMF